MKYYILISILFLSSCYTKKRAIEKFCTQDTFTVSIHDTILTETIKADTFFSSKVDSFFIQKDKLKIVYKKINDTIYLEGECIGDTIVFTKVVKVPLYVKPEKPKKWLLIGAFCAGFFSLLLLRIWISQVLK